MPTEENYIIESSRTARNGYAHSLKASHVYLAAGDTEYSGEPDRPQERDISLQYVVDIVRRRRLMFLCVMALALLAGLVLALRPRTYTASGMLQVRPGTANIYRSQANEGPVDPDSDDRIESEVLVLQSKTLMLAVADELHLYKEPTIAGPSAKQNAASDPVVQARVVNALGKMVKIARKPKTQIITVECTARTPALASNIVSSVMNQYIHRIYETRLSSTRHASTFLTSQLDDLKKQVQQDQQKLVDLQKKLGVSGVDDSHNLETAQLEDLAKANQDANIQRIVSEARYRILQEEDPNLVEGGPTMLSSGSQTAPSLLQSLRSAQAQVGSRYASVSEQFGPNYPETKQLKAQLAQATKDVNKEQSRIVEEAKISFSAARRNQSMTSAALAHQKDLVYQKRNDMVEYQLLRHDFESSRSLYEGLVQRLREAGVLSGIESGDVELVDLPTLPIKPAGLGALLSVGITLVLGLIVALITVMVQESFDSSFHSAAALERYMSLPALTVIPRFPKVAQQRSLTWNLERFPAAPRLPGPLEMIEYPLSGFAESIRMLQTQLITDRTNAHSRVILFTSATRCEGVSTVSANLARVLADSGKRVLLVDANLRHPSHHLRFNLPNDRGFSDLLSGNGTLEGLVLPLPDRPNLHVLVAGPAPKNPGQLLAAVDMRDPFSFNPYAYDAVLVDAPPTLGFADVGLLLPTANAVVLVVREGVATQSMVAEVKRTLGSLGAPLRGVTFFSDSYRKSIADRKGGCRAQA